MTDIKQPIFIVGAGRSGSTIFHQGLALHPHISWLTRILNKYPSKPHLNQRVLNALDTPLIGAWFKQSDRLGGGECYPFWDTYYPGFGRPVRDLVADDVTPGIQKKLHHVLSQTMTPNRPTLMTKITGWPRLSFLYTLFPDARFVHIVRDGRAVAHSLTKVDFWEGWHGPENWRWGKLSPAHETLWEEHNQSFIALAGINWLILMERMQQARKQLDVVGAGSQFLEFKYETLCSEPMDTMKMVLDFCELAWTSDFEQSLQQLSFANTNDKWQQELTDAQQQTLETVTRPYLDYYDYS
ncbi:MAG: sulfotransferase [Chloroflexota bacterium]